MNTLVAIVHSVIKKYKQCQANQTACSSKLSKEGELRKANSAFEEATEFNS